MGIDREQLSVSLRAKGLALQPNGEWSKCATKLEGPSAVVQEREVSKPRVPRNKVLSQKNNESNERRFSYSVTCNFYFPDKRRRDNDGALSTVLDCLVKANVLPDDNRCVVPEIHVFSHDCLKGEERVEVEIKRL